MSAIARLAASVVLAAALGGAGATAANAAGPNAWTDGGDFPSLYDCQQAGQESISHGAERYRCDAVDYPDGAINYWQLWLLY